MELVERVFERQKDKLAEGRQKDKLRAYIMLRDKKTSSDGVCTLVFLSFGGLAPARARVHTENDPCLFVFLSFLEHLSRDKKTKRQASDSVCVRVRGQARVRARAYAPAREADGGSARKSWKAVPATHALEARLCAKDEGPESLVVVLKQS